MVIESLTILNTCVVLYLVIKYRKPTKSNLDKPTTEPVVEHVEIIKPNKFYPNLNPIEIIPVAEITNKDIKNLLLSLSDLNYWHITNFFVSLDRHYLSINSNPISLDAQFENGKCVFVRLTRPINMVISDSKEWGENKNVDFLPNFTLSLWPLYEKASKEYNDSMLKKNGRLSDDIKSIIPKSVLRDDALNDILSD